MDQLAVVIKRPPLLGVMVIVFVNGKRRCCVLLSHSVLYVKVVLCEGRAVGHRIGVLC